MTDLSLLSGPVPVVLLVLAVPALVGLLACRPPSRAWALWIAGAVAVGVAVRVWLNALVVDVLALFPEKMDSEVVAWIGVLAGTVVLLVGALIGTGWRRRLVAAGCALVVVLAAGNQVNRLFAEFPTLADLLGRSEVVPFTPARGDSRFEATPVVDRWAGPAPGMRGTLQSATIPGTVSGFTARDAYIYTPPAYAAPNRPLLPVLLLVAGQPGGPRDWVQSGQLQRIMDRFAAQHDGLAPVTVVVDPNGSTLGNTMCLDSRLARADTYLSRDVRNWVLTELQVDANPAHWTFGGWSFGGTCATQMGTRHPDLFGSFVSLEGELEPALGPNRAQTVQTAFGGDTAAFDALVPMTLLQQRRYPDTWAYFASGGKDPTFTGYMTRLARASAAAGMHVHTAVVPGHGHSWAVPVDQLPAALAWLSPKLGFTRG